jgi:hypothetical protein
MKRKVVRSKLSDHPSGKEEKDNSEGYPVYPVNEDIYGNDLIEDDINPEDISKNKESNRNDKTGKGNEKDFTDVESGSDLDIPGSELDDEQEIIGSEDEENNYYSLGGDDHNDLDEDNGE